MSVKRFGLALALSAAVTSMSGCGGAASQAIDTSVLATGQAQPEQATMGIIPIQSDNVAAAGYDPTTQTMTVQFHEGSVYRYAPVPQSLWDDFVAAQPHPWSAVGYPRLVQAKVPYWRVS